MGELAAELRRLSGTTYDAAGAANAWAGTSGLELVGALNAKAGTTGLELDGVLNRLAGTTGLGVNAAASAITGALVSDSFTRTSAVTLGSADTGQSWTAAVGTWGTTGTQAYMPSGTGGGLATINAGVSDYRVQATLVTSDNGTSLVWRSQDVNNRYSLTAALGTLTMYVRVAGTATQIGQVSGQANGDVLAVDVRGNVYTVYRNGAQVLQVTNSTFATGTTVGLRADTNAARFDDFVVTA